MNMDRFSIEELNLMCIYDTGSRIGLISELQKLEPELAEEDADLIELVQNVLKKLTTMIDQEYSELILVPDYKDEDE